MNLWFRLLWLALALLWRRKLDPRRDVSRLTFRVLPTDLDLNGHMNNGRYLTIMDLGRLDHVLRSGLWRPIWQNGWAPMLGSAVIRYRREMRLFQRFTLETRIAAWSDTTAVMEQTFLDRQRSAEGADGGARIGEGRLLRPQGPQLRHRQAPDRRAGLARPGDREPTA